MRSEITHKPSFWGHAQKKIRKLLFLPQIREYPVSRPIDIWASDHVMSKTPAFFHQPDYEGYKDDPHDSFHSFCWLAEFYKKGGHTAKGQVHKLMSGWLNQYGYSHPIVWKLPVLAKRMQNWIIYFHLLVDEKNDIYQQKLYKALNDQIYELYFQLDLCEDAFTRMRVITSLISVSVSFLSYRKYLKRFLQCLYKEIQQQFYADGSHHQRNPKTDLEYLQLFLDIRSILYAGQQDIPVYLVEAIQNLVNIIHFSRHHDGGLYIINGSHEGDPRFIDFVLKQAHFQPQTLPIHLDNGLLKLKANQVTLFMDCGERSEKDKGHAHASPLSFELSIGRTRVITSCGYTDDESYQAWQPGLRSSDAYSTMTINNESPVFPYKAQHFLSEQQGHSFLRTSHDGYKKKYGVEHQRHIYLNPEGDNIIGEDILEGFQPIPLKIRFHLHPLILCAPLPKKNQLLLRLPDGSAWRFIAGADSIALQESVYFGYQGQKKRSEQIVISFDGDEDSLEEAKHIIRWSLRKIQ